MNRSSLHLLAMNPFYLIGRMLTDGAAGPLALNFIASGECRTADSASDRVSRAAVADG